MTPKDIAEKYVHGKHDALTDNQEIEDIIKDIEEYAKQKDERIKELEARNNKLFEQLNSPCPDCACG